VEIIELKDNEAAFVLNEEGGMRMYIPNVGDDENMPENGLFMSAIGVLLKKDDGLYQYVMDRFFEEILPPEKLEELVDVETEEE
jgi:hypothetical protein